GAGLVARGKMVDVDGALPSTRASAFADRLFVGWRQIFGNEAHRAARRKAHAVEDVSGISAFDGSVARRLRHTGGPPTISRDLSLCCPEMLTPHQACYRTERRPYVLFNTSLIRGAWPLRLRAPPNLTACRIS